MAQERNVNMLKHPRTEFLWDLPFSSNSTDQADGQIHPNVRVPPQAQFKELKNTRSDFLNYVANMF